MALFGGGNGLDISNYQPQFQDQTFAQKAKDAGVANIMIGYQRPDIADAQAAACTKVDISRLCTYAFLYFGFNGFMGYQDLITDQTAKAIAGAQKWKFPRVVADVEADGINARAGVTTAERIADLWKSIKMIEAAGLEPAIYTGDSYWRAYMGNTTEFSKYPLMLASYYYDLRHITKVSFGGWTDVWAHQYTSSGTQYYIDAQYHLGPAPQLLGVDVDYDIFYDVGGKEQEEDDLSQADKDAIAQLQKDVAALTKQNFDLRWAIFSGNEERDKDMNAREADVQYRIDEILGRASDGTVMNSVACTAQAAMNFAKSIAQQVGMTEEQVDAAISEHIQTVLAAATQAAGGK